MQKSFSRDVNAYMRENYDRLHVLTPLGTKEMLRDRLPEGLTLNKYVNILIDLDLRGKVDWSDADEGFRVLREMAAAEKG